jgi:hypothetical protein
MSGVKKPESIIGDSFDGWIETFRTQAAADRMRGRYVECNRRNRGLRPSALTISSWYLSTGQAVSGREEWGLAVTGKVT